LDSHYVDIPEIKQKKKNEKNKPLVSRLRLFKKRKMSKQNKNLLHIISSRNSYFLSGWALSTKQKLEKRE